ncbi:hypothetical protein C7M84_017098 [Penaeus vannamei]|uniref:Uncharacterized protein n=1 Tax=Penaeus vannamei TaxID=6689 RepID=A0A3R7MLP3_PENVA|nr:hypothetical protein C7M84_017098 [Penaeus vannamei]
MFYCYLHPLLSLYCYPFDAFPLLSAFYYYLPLLLSLHCLSSISISLLFIPLFFSSSSLLLPCCASNLTSLFSSLLLLPCYISNLLLSSSHYLSVLPPPSRYHPLLFSFCLPAIIFLFFIPFYLSSSLPLPCYISNLLLSSCHYLSVLPPPLAIILSSSPVLHIKSSSISLLLSLRSPPPSRYHPLLFSFCLPHHLSVLLPLSLSPSPLLLLSSCHYLSVLPPPLVITLSSSPLFLPLFFCSSFPSIYLLLFPFRATYQFFFYLPAIISPFFPPPPPLVITLSSSPSVFLPLSLCSSFPSIYLLLFPFRATYQFFFLSSCHYLSVLPPPSSYLPLLFSSCLPAIISPFFLPPLVITFSSPPSVFLPLFFCSSFPSIYLLLFPFRATYQIFFYLPVIISPFFLPLSLSPSPLLSPNSPGTYSGP